MPNDSDKKSFDEIFDILRDDMGYSLDGTLLFAEVASNWASTSIFKDRGDDILFRWPEGALHVPLLDLWEAEDPDKRWAEIEFVIRDGTFHAIFNYPADIDPDEDEFVRRDRIVKGHFGDKPIVYPPWHRGEDGIRFEG